MGKRGNNKKKEFLTTEEYIDFLSRQSNEINMGNHNSKTGIACLNLAFPTCVCRADAPCMKECYANKGCQKISSVQAAYYRNLRLYNEDPVSFFEQVSYKIKYSGLKMVRLFDSGDFPDIDFLYLICDICRKFPDVKFMAFTKKYELVNEYLKDNKLPDNFNILFSAWDKLWSFDNPYNLGVAYVKFNDNRLTPDYPKESFICPGRQTTCSSCGACWSKKLKSVVFKQH